MVIMIGIRWFFTEERASSRITPLDHQKIPHANGVVSEFVKTGEARDSSKITQKVSAGTGGLGFWSFRSQ